MRGLAATLAGIDDGRIGPGENQQRRVDERIDQDSIGFRDGVQRVERRKARIARSGACKPHPARLQAGEGERFGQPADRRAIIGAKGQDGTHFYESNCVVEIITHIVSV